MTRSRPQPSETGLRADPVVPSPVGWSRAHTGQVRRLLAFLATGVLLLSACTDAEDRSGPGTGAPRATSGQASGEGPNEAPPPSDETPTAAEDPSAEDLPPVPHAVSLPALMRKEVDGRGFRLGALRERTAAYTSRRATYRSGELRISGVVNIPHGEGPFPAVVLAHGYIDPAVYVSGQGMTRERGVLAEAGFIAFHVDYRNHASSGRDELGELDLRMGYTEDVINAVAALRRWDGPVDRDRIGLVGRSMGGGVVQNVLTVQPKLVTAAVVFASVSSDAVDNFDRWVRTDHPEVARRIIDEYGAPGRARKFWRGVSARTYFDRVLAPLMVHHGTADDSCPVGWSDETVRLLRGAGKRVRYHVYDGEGHAFGPQFDLAMRRTVEFLERNL